MEAGRPEEVPPSGDDLWRCFKRKRKGNQTRNGPTKIFRKSEAGVTKDWPRSIETFENAEGRGARPERAAATFEVLVNTEGTGAKKSTAAQRRETRRGAPIFFEKKIF